MKEKDYTWYIQQERTRLKKEIDEFEKIKKELEKDIAYEKAAKLSDKEWNLDLIEETMNRR